jgi:hypothetical protein
VYRGANLPAWHVDANQLRDVLDRIRLGLTSGAVLARAPMPFTFALPHERVAASLKALLSVLDNVDLEAGRLLPPTFGTSYQPDHADDLRELIEALAATLRSRLRQALIPKKLTALSELLSHPMPDLLAIFGRGNDENSHSDVLRWLLDPRSAPTVAPPTLCALTSHLPDSTTWHDAIIRASRTSAVSARRELVFGREWPTEDARGRIDIVISGPGFLLAIENKIWAAEHDGQTAAYWNWLANVSPLRAGLFLTPTGVPPRCSEFVPVSYLELVSCLLTAPSAGAVDPAEASVLAGYLKTLAASVLRSELRWATGLTSSSTSRENQT